MVCYIGGTAVIQTIGDYADGLDDCSTTVRLISHLMAIQLIMLSVGPHTSHISPAARIIFVTLFIL